MTSSPLRSRTGSYAPRHRLEPAGHSRRQFLVGAAGTAAAAGSAAMLSSSPALAFTQPAGLPLVKPIAANKVVHSFGVNAQPSNLKSVYVNTDAWMQAVVSTGATYFRGMYAPGLPTTMRIIQNARDMGLRWGMEVAPTIDTDPASVIATIQHIAANAADRCLYIEGVNEPNNVRGLNVAPAFWKPKVSALQQTIYQAVRSDPRLDHVIVLGPSLRDVAATTQDYLDLSEYGLTANFDYVGLHRYPNGNYPGFLMDDRVNLVNELWPDKKIWFTEHGYTNAVNSTSGQLAVPESVSAAYGPSSILESADRGVPIAWFEALDDVDPGKDDVESNFGMFATVSANGVPPWRAKPVVASVAGLLNLLADPGPGFNPPRIPLQVTSSIPDVKTTVTAKRDGSAMVHLRRATNCWDPRAAKPITVQPATVVVQTATSSTTLQIDHRVTSLSI